MAPTKIVVEIVGWEKPEGTIDNGATMLFAALPPPIERFRFSCIMSAKRKGSTESRKRRWTLQLAQALQSVPATVRGKVMIANALRDALRAQFPEDEVNRVSSNLIDFEPPVREAN